MPTAVLSGGGTAGHINPALALAEELKDRGWTVYYAGTPTGVEARLVKNAGIPFKPFVASGFDRSKPWTMISGSYKIFRSTKKARAWFKEINPDVVVAFGGYVCLPVGMAAEELKIPVVLHEQNSVMGMANKFLAKHAKAICMTYASTENEIDDKWKVHHTGNPVRKSVLEATREDGRKYLGIPEDAEVLLVFGGSLGARHINEAIMSMKDELLARKNLYVVHITGPKDFEDVQEKLGLSDEEKKRYILKSYEDNMADVLAASDLIVSRAGATSLAEISARAIPALLVPYPYATADHQTTNAKDYVASGAAFMIADSDVETDEFKHLVSRLVDEPDLRAKMHKAAKEFSGEDATIALADVVARGAK